MSAGRLRVPGLAVLAALLACAESGSDAPRPALTAARAPAGFAAPESAALPDPPDLAEARAQLGRRLFFDRRLSRTSAVSCASCHRPALAFTEPDPVGTGVAGRRGTRNPPALVNLAWAQSLFWDGRTRTLEAQVGEPIENPTEMDLPLALAVGRLEADPAYVDEFAAAYSAPPSEATLRRALASFLRALVSGDSAYDRFLRGDAGALDAAARRGLDLFFGAQGGCFHCHPAGPLTNDGFFNNGSFVAGGDPGRAAVTGRTGDLGKFKVPGLRNVAVTAPYMHDGSVATLEDVVEQYARGGRGGPNTDAVIEPLALTPDEKSDLVAFLRALTDEAFLADPRFRE